MKVKLGSIKLNNSINLKHNRQERFEQSSRFVLEDERDVEEHYCGPMDQRCEHCNAIKVCVLYAPVVYNILFDSQFCEMVAILLFLLLFSR